MIMGLALAAIMGLQSFSLLSHPFASEAASSAGGTGVLSALIVVVGASFTLHYPIAAVVGFGLAAVLAITTGSNSPFTDLQVWGWGLSVLAVLGVIATLKTATPNSASPSPFAQGSAPAAITGDGATTNPFAPAGNGSPSAESNLVDQLERLGRLRASGALNEAEFAAMKASLLTDRQTTTGVRT